MCFLDLFRSAVWHPHLYKNWRGQSPLWLHLWVPDRPEILHKERAWHRKRSYRDQRHQRSERQIRHSIRHRSWCLLREHFTAAEGWLGTVQVRFRQLFSFKFTPGVWSPSYRWWVSLISQYSSLIGWFWLLALTLTLLELTFWTLISYLWVACGLSICKW